MSFWEGRDVVLTLSTAGQEVFGDLFDARLVRVFVQWQDETGLWIVRDRQESGEVSVMLIKWLHFESAQLDLILAPQLAPRPLGFSR